MQKYIRKDIINRKKNSL